MILLANIGSASKKYALADKVNGGAFQVRVAAHYEVSEI